MDGTGQTIAIVDAFDDPTIVADVKVFDAKFNLPPVVINEYNQNGRRVRGLAPDRGWASEIAMDVEWAHAIAPGATIALVETNSDDTDDLLAGVNAARGIPGVSVVSLSWGADEYRSETADDAYFTTPRGHSGVTFVAAAGDEGKAPAEWPASSPNVISVGGTTLKLTAAGDYYSESTWSDTTGGTSKYEATPTFQTGVTSSTKRSTPDVAYNANPDTGFAVYDTYGSDGWTVLAGTSAGVPQWAALVALANQSRVAAGGLPLDGPSQTLPALYSPAATATGYASAFNDVTTGSNSTEGNGGGDGGWGGPRLAAPAASAPTATAANHPVKASAASGVSATAGYDLVTGLGTPKAAAVIPALANYAPPTASTRRRRRATPSIARPTTAHDSAASQNVQPQIDARPAVTSAENPVVVLAPALTPPVTIALQSGPAAIEGTLAIANAALTVSAASAPVVATSAGRLDAGGSHVVDLPTVSSDVPALPLSKITFAVTQVAANFATQVASTAGLTDTLGSPLVGPAGSTFAFAPADVGTTFFDAMALFAHESTQAIIPGEVEATSAARRFGSPRAWSVTLGVLALDAVLLGRWLRGRARRREEEQLLDLEAFASPFAVLPASVLVDDQDEYYSLT